LEVRLRQKYELISHDIEGYFDKSKFHVEGHTAVCKRSCPKIQMVWLWPRTWY